MWSRTLVYKIMFSSPHHLCLLRLCSLHTSFWFCLCLSVVLWFSEFKWFTVYSSCQPVFLWYCQCSSGSQVDSRVKKRDVYKRQHLFQQHLKSFRYSSFIYLSCPHSILKHPCSHSDYLYKLSLSLIFRFRNNFLKKKGIHIQRLKSQTFSIFIWISKYLQQMISIMIKFLKFTFILVLASTTTIKIQSHVLKMIYASSNFMLILLYFSDYIFCYVIQSNFYNQKCTVIRCCLLYTSRCV